MLKFGKQTIYAAQHSKDDSSNDEFSSYESSDDEEGQSQNVSHERISVRNGSNLSSECENEKQNRRNAIMNKRHFQAANLTVRKRKKREIEVRNKTSREQDSSVRSPKTNKFPKFLKRIHVTSEESDSGAQKLHVKKKRKKFSEADDTLPSFLKNLALSLDGESDDDDENALPVQQQNYADHIPNEAAGYQQFEVEDIADNAFSEVEDRTDNAYNEENSCDSGILKILPDVSVTSIPFNSAEIVVLRHPTSVTLHKFINVSVVSGGVSILGYTLNSLSPPATVFSFENTGLIKLTTLHSDPMWNAKESYKSIKETLMLYTIEERALKILEKCDNSSVIVVLQKASYPMPLQMLTLYFPKLTWIRKYPRSNRHFVMENGIEQAMHFSTSCDDLATIIKSAMRKSRLKNRDGPRILICGGKGTGKSTILRYVINKVLNMFPHVFYLDADPGQPEFTPPGVLSLSKVDKAMLGPPFSHLRSPVKMIFTGAISANTSPPMYSKSIHQLMQIFSEEYANETLFVNTMGWMQGIGLEILDVLRKAVNPTIIVEVISQREAQHFTPGKELKDSKVQIITIPSIKREVASCAYSAKEKRDFSIVAYFGKCNKPYLRPKFLNEMPSFCICWDNIPIYVFGKKLVPYRIVEAINASFVALCSVEDSLILDSDIPGFQSTLEDEPTNNCLGFGLVRAVDETNHLLYIITPLKLAQLQKVNAIMKGTIVLPQAVFLEQKITKTPLPFLDHSKSTPSRARTTACKKGKRGPKQKTV